MASRAGSDPISSSAQANTTNGISSTSPSYSLGSKSLNASPAVVQIMFTFAGIALYNAVELVCLLLVTFNRYRGLYFWSLFLTTFGIVPYTIFLLFKFFAVLPSKYNLLDIAFLDVGWQLMVTGQSIVMYSRLHLLVPNKRTLFFVRWMIILNWFVSNIPTTILVFLSNTDLASRTMRIYGIWERLQLVLYFCQEIIISMVYIKAIFNMGTDDGILKWSSWRKMLWGKRGPTFEIDPVAIMRHLVQMNLLVIGLDISLLIMEFAGYYDIQVIYKGALYSVKLKIEFWILNQLTAMASRKLKSSNSGFGSAGYLEGSQTETATGTITSTAWGGKKNSTPTPLASPSIQQTKRHSFPYALDHDNDLAPTPPSQSNANLPKPPSLHHKDSKLSQIQQQDPEKPQSSEYKIETERWQIPR